MGYRDQKYSDNNGFKRNLDETRHMRNKTRMEKQDKKDNQQQRKRILGKGSQRRQQVRNICKDRKHERNETKIPWNRKPSREMPHNKVESGE